MATDLQVWAEGVAQWIFEDAGKGIHEDVRVFWETNPEATVSEYAEYAFWCACGAGKNMSQQAKHAVLYQLEQITIGWFECLENHGIGMYPLEVRNERWQDEVLLG